MDQGLLRRWGAEVRHLAPQGGNPRPASPAGTRKSARAALAPGRQQRLLQAPLALGICSLSGGVEVG